MKLAIIGASVGQRALHLKAREKGLEILTFAWEEGAVCRDLADRFYPISVTETDRIADICRAEGVSGVVSNASELTAATVAHVAAVLNLPGVSPAAVVRCRDKAAVRRLANEIPRLGRVRTFSADDVRYPCVVKPVSAAGKRGVSFVASSAGLSAAIDYARAGADNEGFLIEEFVAGREFSVETLSFQGRHLTVQITDKVNSGPPHFVELAHHQPSALPVAVQRDVERAAAELLTAVGYDNGAAHVEMKLGEDGRLYLIEVNPRGGGDEISNTLVGLSTDFDYVGGMIDVALGLFRPPASIRRDVACAGIHFLCRQNAGLLPVFRTAAEQPWFVKSEEPAASLLTKATGNGSRDGWFVYRADRRLEFK